MLAGVPNHLIRSAADDDDEVEEDSRLRRSNGGEALPKSDDNWAMTVDEGTGFDGSRIKDSTKKATLPGEVGATREGGKAVEDATATLNIHVVPHTHDDVGWLKTVEQYYLGLNNSIQFVSVDDILTSVVESLLENPQRTFTYVEQKFFTMWWDRQPDAVRADVRQLVQEGRLNFVNGGWCMHDEAATHYVGMIDQTTLGHDFLNRTFGVVPTVGWQLDPFGHSATQASLLSYRMGLDALYFGRIDHEDLAKRQLTQECEGLWNASTSWTDSSVFWGLTGSYLGNYGPPTGFCFDVHCDHTSLIDMNRTALHRSVEHFLIEVRQQSDRTKGSHVMLTMGEDFNYQRASVNFANLDLLLGTIQRLQESKEIDIPGLFGPRFDRVNIFYSSPNYYTQCKYEETVQHPDIVENRMEQSGNVRTVNLRHTSENMATNRRGLQESDRVQWSVKQDDFFPYSDCPNCFWTGYFTSRPALKRFERVGSSFLMAARQIEAMLDYDGKVDREECIDPLHQLEDAHAVLQHHDGVSGTSKQHVAYDYAKRLQAGIDGVAPCTIRKLKRLLLGEATSDKAGKPYLKDLMYCQLLNETKCDVSMSATTAGGAADGELDLYVVVYNSLAKQRTTAINLPVATGGMYLVHAETDSPVVVSAHPDLLNTNNMDGRGPFVVSFDTGSLPALGAKVFRVHKSRGEKPRGGNSDASLHHSENRQLQGEGKERNQAVKVSNGIFTVEFDSQTGNIQQIGPHAIQNLTTWGYYTSFDSRLDKMRDNDNQDSGAYIFRPSVPDQKLKIIHATSAQITNSSSGVEVHVKYEVPWIATTTRILKNVPYVEIEYQVGPIPVDDGRGKEVVVRYNTMVDHPDGTIYTDSNGREFLKRRRNFRPTWDMTVYEPVAGNYYPVNAAMYLQNDNGGPAMAVVTDRTQGGASILDGTMELMVHRRTLVDDWRGVFEAIDETDGGITPCPPYGNATRLGKGILIRGKHRILVGNGNKGGGASLARSAMDEAFADPLVFVGSAPSTENVPFRVTSFSGLKQPLPKNVMLITKRLLYDKDADKTYLIRLGHQYGLGEDDELSQPTNVDISALFPGQSVTGILETTLSGNRDIGTWRKERLQWTGKGEHDRGAADEITYVSDHGTLSATITLEPMDIRTFKVTLRGF